MNRAERRKLGVKNKESVFIMKKSDIEQIKKDASRESIEVAFKLMLAIPVKVLSENFGKITKLNVDGKSREERFTDLCLKLWDDFNADKVSINDLQDILTEKWDIQFK